MACGSVNTLQDHPARCSDDLTQNADRKLRTCIGISASFSLARAHGSRISSSTKPCAASAAVLGGILLQGFRYGRHGHLPFRLLLAAIRAFHVLVIIFHAAEHVKVFSAVLALIFVDWHILSLSWAISRQILFSILSSYHAIWKVYSKVAIVRLC
jgi:hypothetical protein